MADLRRKLTPQELLNEIGFTMSALEDQLNASEDVKEIAWLEKQISRLRGQYFMILKQIDIEV